MTIPENFWIQPANGFSTNSRVFLSAFVECLIKQMALNGTVCCIADKKKIIQLDHILDTSVEGFEERFPLYPMITHLSTFLSMSAQHATLSSDLKRSLVTFQTLVKRLLRTSTTTESFVLVLKLVLATSLSVRSHLSLKLSSLQKSVCCAQSSVRRLQT